MTAFPLPSDPLELDAALEAVPNRPAVFLLWAGSGEPYLARTNVLRRRLTKLLGTTEKPGKALNLRGTVERVEYRLTGSTLESWFVLLEQARLHLGPDYRSAVRLRMPPYVKLILTNRFPRTQVARQLGRAKALYFGPFRNRSTAAKFESEFLDLFQLRRCQDDLDPTPEHPGCIYGEMGKCLRPCQEAVGVGEYRTEADRVREFLHTAGKSLLNLVGSARERASGDLDFEAAATMHQRYIRVQEVLALSDEMARDVEALHAVAVLPSSVPETIVLGWIRGGYWQGTEMLELAIADGRTMSLDTRLREAVQRVAAKAAPEERAEQLAIIARWFYSTWRDGEMLLFDSWEKFPYRKLVNAVSRVAQGKKEKPPKPRPSTHSSEPDSNPT